MKAHQKYSLPLERFRKIPRHPSQAMLGADGHSQVTFRSRGHEVQANLTGLRKLTARCHDAASDFISQFSNFYAELALKKPTGSEFEMLLQTVLNSSLR